MSGWQLIDTAPRDGTRILAYGLLAFESEPGIGTVRWATSQWECDPNEATEYIVESCKVTHWVPLPEPPK